MFRGDMTQRNVHEMGPQWARKFGGGGLCLTFQTVMLMLGRLKTRWEDDVRKDIQKLKVFNWKTLVQDRRRWKELVEKAKTLHKKL